MQHNYLDSRGDFRKMTTQEFIGFMNTTDHIDFETDARERMTALSHEAMKITMEINNKYHTPEEIRELFSELTGKEVDESFRLFPPFTTDCGKNITLGKNVFINSGCRFQDQGGITIDDGALIGHNVVIATLNHDLAPEKRQCLIPSGVHIGKNVWIGSGSIILPGVTVGDNSVIGAGSVVTKDVPPNTVAVGSPARIVKTVI